jgi:hypothetical protein
MGKRIEKMISAKMKRRSPVHLPGKPEKTKMRDHWPVVLAYSEEGPGPWIVDFSHCRRWDIQSRDLDEALPSGASLPESPGSVVLHTTGLTGRAGQRQAFHWLFNDKAAAPAGFGCTEITEGSLCFALLGGDIFKITEKLTSLDLCDPKHSAPFLLIGPFSNITCQIVVLRNDPKNAAVLISCSRGFAHDMVRAVLAAGEEFGLRPAGERCLMEKLAECGLRESGEVVRKPSKADKAKPVGRSRS